MIRLIRPATFLMLLSLTATIAGGSPIACEGVLGNSGEAGESLVRFGAFRSGRDPSGMGVVFDRFGCLWDRAGIATLNRYALDGRLLAQYPINGASAPSDRLTRHDDTIVLLIREKLYALDIAAPSGTAPRDLKLSVKMISVNHDQGRFAGLDSTGKLAWIQPLAGKMDPILELPVKQVRALDVAADGSIMAYADGMVHRVAGDKLITDAMWPRRIHGDRDTSPEGLHRLGDFWYSYAWHGTIKRYDADLAPAPGVVLGGGSGWFIGHVPSNDELSFGQGMAQLSDDLFAVSGIAGVMHLLHWDAAARRMEIVRRLGAMSGLKGLTLDSQGRIGTGIGTWNWSDGPATPLAEASGPELMGQGALLDNGNLATPATRYGGSRPTWLSGPPTDDRRIEDRTDFVVPQQEFTGAVALRSGSEYRVLLVTAAGEGRIIRVGGDGRFNRILGSFTLQAPAPVQRWSTLAMQDPTHLLAAGDGAIHRFVLKGETVTADGLWTPQDKTAGTFGKSICITADAGRLWVADTERHRVLCFSLADGVQLGQFGKTDSAGQGLDELREPTAIAACGARAVVLDRGNQRLVKMAVE